jgi:hypothetical protein
MSARVWCSNCIKCKVSDAWLLDLLDTRTHLMHYTYYNSAIKTHSSARVYKALLQWLLLEQIKLLLCDAKTWFTSFDRSPDAIWWKNLPSAPADLPITCATPAALSRSSIANAWSICVCFTLYRKPIYSRCRVWFFLYVHHTYVSRLLQQYLLWL